MRILAFAAALALLLPVAAVAQSSQSGASSGGGGGNIAALLADGYEIKAAFVNANISYVFLQKLTSAYMCKSTAGSVCEKLN